MRIVERAVTVEPPDVSVRNTYDHRGDHFEAESPSYGGPIFSPAEGEFAYEPSYPGQHEPRVVAVQAPPSTPESLPELQYDTASSAEVRSLVHEGGLVAHQALFSVQKMVDECRAVRDCVVTPPMLDARRTSAFLDDVLQITGSNDTELIRDRLFQLEMEYAGATWRHAYGLWTRMNGIVYMLYQGEPPVPS